MHKRPDPIRKRLSIAVLCAIGIHALFIPALEWLLNRPLPADSTPPVGMQRNALTMLTEAEVAALLGSPDSTPAPAPEAKPEEEEEEKKKKKKPEMPDGQVVEIPPPPREEVPDESQFVSEFNSKVERETANRNQQSPTPRMKEADEIALSRGDDDDGTTRDLRKARTKPKRKPDQARPPSSTPGPGMAQAQKATPTIGSEDGLDPSARKISLLDPQERRLTINDGEFRHVEGAADRQHVKRGGAGPAGGADAPADYRSLLPSMGPEETARSDGTINYLEDVDDGNATFLNTREYKYAWYFNRVVREVNKHWKPNRAYRRRDPYGRIHGVRGRLTIVEVTLSATGELEDIYLKKDSGVEFLDEVAVSAFREAQPFPNPPEGLRDGNGKIMFQMAFRIEFTTGGFRMFRYR